MWRRNCFLAVLSLAVLTSSIRAQEDLNDLHEKMTKDASRKVAPSVVQIETRGGADMVVAGPKGQIFRKALGPTTGVVVGADGYIITSAFNFLNNPPQIFVRVQGQQGDPLVATRVATDKSRMLTLIKVESKSLTVPAFVPKKDIKEGQWAIALGRALDAKMEKTPSVSVGVISALNRIWGKALQTDAKISPVNYGGPIVDSAGRVQGIIIPASPNGEDVTAGLEWYDSGIGFAIPMEDILAVLPRLKQGKDLQKGLLGIAMKSPDKFSVLPEIGTVQKASSAEKAGLKPGDVLIEIEGKAVVNMAQVQHILGGKYEGDKISLKYQRGKDTVEIKSLELTGKDVVIAQPFLGILPLRDDPRLGVEVRHVFDKSPAETAGIKIGDRIMKFGVDEKNLTEFTGDKAGRGQFLDWLGTLTPGTAIKLALKRKAGDKTDTVSVTLSDLPGSLPGIPAKIIDKLPEGDASFKKALAPLELNNPNVKAPKVVAAEPPMPETGLLELNTPDGEHKYWLWVYPQYDPNIAHSLVVWMHPPGKNSKEDLDGWADLWDEYCRKHQIILCMPVEKQDGWLPTHADFVVAATRETIKTYTIDKQRVVAHGMAVGGQMAMHLAFNHRDLFKGAAAIGSTASGIKDNIGNQRLSFYLAGGDLDPLNKYVAESRTRLAEKRYPAFYREMEKRGREYAQDVHIQEMVRWLETLDQQ